MKLVYDGKTKAVYQQEDGLYQLRFKDDVTGENGVFDPGANTVGLSIEGMGRGSIRMTDYYFSKIEAAGIPTHRVSTDLSACTMTVKPATLFGKGIEVICRYRAVGSFLRRYGDYAQDGQPLDAYVEITLKSDDRGDPLITKEGLAILNILTPDEYDTLVALTRQICAVIRDDLAEKGIELYDIKLEFGRVDGGVVLIDEISGGNMRAYKDGVYIGPMALVKMLLG